MRDGEARRRRRARANSLDVVLVRVLGGDRLAFAKVDRAARRRGRRCGDPEAHEVHLDAALPRRCRTRGGGSRPRSKSAPSSRLMRAEQVQVERRGHALRRRCRPRASTAGSFLQVDADEQPAAAAGTAPATRAGSRRPRSGRSCRSSSRGRTPTVRGRRVAARAGRTAACSRRQTGSTRRRG